jgi:hypothetical protein
MFENRGCEGDHHMKPKPVKTSAGSFPKFALHRGLTAKAKKRWQVLCGDKNHWRVGYYSPTDGKTSQVKKLEKHTCVELFLLLSGSVTLILDDGRGEYQLRLKPLQPVMVTGWHCGYCPNGAFTGVAMVVERDQFSTIYRDRS